MDENDTLADPAKTAEAVPPSRLAVQGETDVGLVRSNNEDFQHVTRISKNGRTYGLWVVADGMGGGVRGEVASKTAAEAAERYLRDEEWTDPHDGLKAAFAMANALVFDEGTGGGKAARSLMGTTLVVAMIDEEAADAWIANVGDSRAYLASERGLTPLTEDHSLVAERVAAGLITREEAAHAPDRNIVTRAIGTDASVECDVFGPRRLLPGETLILCSDGLHGMVPEEMILDIVRTYPVPELPGVLIGAAKDHGGRDNITVVAGGLRAGLAAAAPVATAPAPAALDATVETPMPGVLPAPRARAAGERRRILPLLALGAVAAGLVAIVIGGAALLAGGGGDEGDASGGAVASPTQEDDEDDNDDESPSPSPGVDGDEPVESATAEATATAEPSEPESSSGSTFPLNGGPYTVRQGDDCGVLADRALAEWGLGDVGADPPGDYAALIEEMNPGVDCPALPVGEEITLPTRRDFLLGPGMSDTTASSANATATPAGTQPPGETETSTAEETPSEEESTSSSSETPEPPATSTPTPRPPTPTNTPPPPAPTRTPIPIPMPPPIPTATVGSLGPPGFG